MQPSSMSKLELYTKALDAAALLVAKFGDEFLPAFVAMEEQLERLQAQETAKERALRLASQRAMRASAD